MSRRINCGQDQDPFSPSNAPDSSGSTTQAIGHTDSRPDGSRDLDDRNPYLRSGPDHFTRFPAQHENDYELTTGEAPPAKRLRQLGEQMQDFYETQQDGGRRDQGENEKLSSQTVESSPGYYHHQIPSGGQFTTMISPIDDSHGVEYQQMSLTRHISAEDRFQDFSAQDCDVQTPLHYSATRGRVSNSPVPISTGFSARTQIESIIRSPERTDQASSIQKGVHKRVYRELSQLGGPTTTKPDDHYIRQNQLDHGTSGDTFHYQTPPSNHVSEGSENPEYLRGSMRSLSKVTGLPSLEISVQSHEAATSARKHYLQNPEQYRARILRLEDIVSSALINCINFSTESLNTRIARVDWLASERALTINVEELGTTNLNEAYLMLHILLRQNLFLVQRIIRVLEIFVVCGFSSASYSIITFEAKRPSVIRLVSITVAELVVLEDLLLAAVDVISYHLRDNSTQYWSGISNAMTDLKDAVQLIFDHLELSFPDIYNIRSHLDLYRLRQVSYAVAALFFGLLSYIRSHTGNFDETLFGHRLDELVISVADSSFSLSRRRLGCLHDFVGDLVWVLSTTPPGEKSTEYYLSTSLADFDDLWGPLLFQYEDEDQDQIRSIFTRAGSLRKVLSTAATNTVVNSLRDEVLCHWNSWMELSNLPYTPFYIGDFRKLLIGVFAVPNVHVRLTPFDRPKCCCKVKNVHAFEWFALNTEPFSYRPEARIAQLGLANWVSFNVSQSWKVHPETTVKDLILGEWLISSHHNFDPDYLDWYVVVETSACTGHSRRISFWDLMKVPRISNYVRQILGGDSLGSLNLGESTLFQSTWNQADKECRATLKRIVEILLEKLHRTGVRGTDLLLWDVSSAYQTSVGPNGRKFQPNWYHLARDSEHTATFAILSDTCFYYKDKEIYRVQSQDPKWPWKSISRSGWFEKTLYTRIYIPTRFRFIAEANHSQDSETVKTSVEPTTVVFDCETSELGNYGDSADLCSQTNDKPGSQLPVSEPVRSYAARALEDAGTGGNYNATLEISSDTIEQNMNDFQATKEFTGYARMASAAKASTSIDNLYETKGTTAGDTCSKTGIEEFPDPRDARMVNSENVNDELLLVIDRLLAESENTNILFDQQKEIPLHRPDRSPWQGPETPLGQSLSRVLNRSIHNGRKMPSSNPYAKPRIPKRKGGSRGMTAIKTQRESTQLCQMEERELRAKVARIETQSIEHAPKPHQPNRSQTPSLSLFGRDLPVHNGKGLPIGNLRLKTGLSQQEIDLGPGPDRGGIYAEWQAHSWLGTQLNGWATKVESFGESMKRAGSETGIFQSGDSHWEERAYCKE